MEHGMTPEERWQTERAQLIATIDEKIAAARKKAREDVIDSLYAYFLGRSNPGECHYEMNSDRCYSYNGNCEICVLDHAVESLRAKKE